MGEERLRVLLVDDEDSFRIPLQRYLTRTFGYEVDDAPTAARARERIETATRPYDVALIDDLLVPAPGSVPQSLGVELIEDIRERSPETECIVLTGWGKDRELAALQAGAFRYLAKPFDSEELALLIRTAAQQVRLKAIGRAILSEREPSRVLDGIAGAACSLASADEAAIVLWDRATGELQMHAKTYPAEQQWQRHFAGQSLSRKIIRTGQIERVPDTTQDPRVDRKLVEAGIRSFLGLPIPGDDGNLGVLYVYGYETGYFEEWGAVAVLQTLAGQAGLAIANARAFQQIQSHAGYMEALVRAGRGLTRATELGDQLALAWEFVREQLQVSTFFIGLYDHSAGLLRFPVAYEQGEPLQVPDRHLGKDRAQWGIGGYVVKKGHELVWSTAEEEQQLCAAHRIQSIPVGLPPEQQTCFYLPLRTGDQVIGVMSIQSYARYAFSPILLDAFRALGSQLAVALENARLLDRARRASDQSLALNRIVYEIGTEPDASTLLRSVVERGVELLSAEGGGVWLLDPSGQYRALAEGVGLPVAMKGQRVSWEEGLGGEILRTGRQQAVDNYRRWDKRLKPLDKHNLTAVAGAPIRAGDETRGVLIVHDTRPSKRFGAGDLELLQQLADHAGLALQKVAVMDKLQAIQQVSTNITSSLEFQEVLNRTCQAAVELFGADHSGLVLFDQHLEWGTVRGEYPAHLHTLGARIRIQGVAAEEQLALRGEPVFYHDLAQAVPEFEPVRELLRGFDIRSISIVPIIFQDRILGSFSLDSVGHTRRFTREEIDLCKIFAAQVAVAIENARLFEATREGQAFVQSLFEATSAIISHTRKDRVLRAIVDTACAATGAWRAVALLVDEGEQPQVLAQAGFDHDLEPATSIRSNGVSRAVIHSGQPSFFPDVLEAGREAHPAMVEQGTRAAACLPLHLRDKVIGVLWIQYRETHPFSQIERHALQIYASQAAIAIENARLYQETRSRERLLTALDEASRHIRAEREPSRLLHEIVRLAVGLVGGTAGCLFVHRPYLGDLELQDPYGLPSELIGTRLSSQEGLVGQVARTGRSQVIHNYDVWPDREAAFEVFGFRTAIGVPLEKAGQVEAVLWIGFGPGAACPSATALEVLERFAAQAAIGWQTSRLMGREQRMLAQLGFLREIGSFIQAAWDLDKILHVVLTGVTANYGLAFNRAALFLLDERREYLVGRMGIGHLDEQKARQDWAADQARGLAGFPQYLELLEGGPLPLTPVGERVTGLRFPATSKQFESFMAEMSRRRCALAMPGELGSLHASFLEAFEPDSQLVVVPLMARGQPIGLLVADNKFTRAPITAEDQEALLTFVNTAAVAIDNAQLFHEARTGQERLRSFYEASNAVVLSKDFEQVLQDVVERARTAAKADGVGMVLIDEIGEVRSLVTAGIDRLMTVTDMVRKTGLSTQVVQTGQEVMIEDTSMWEEQLNPSTFWHNVTAALCLPMILEGESLGVVWFFYVRGSHHFAASELDAIQLYVNQATLAYDSARRIKELEHLRQAAEALAGAAGPEEVLDQIVIGAREVLQADSATILSYDDVRDTFIPEQSVASGIPAKLWREFQAEDPRVGRTADKVLELGYVPVSDVADVSQYAFLGDSTRKLLSQLGVQAFQGIALKIGEEHLGALYVNYGTRRAFRGREREVVLAFAHHAALALKKAKLLKQLGDARDAAQVVAKVSALENLPSTLNSIAYATLQTLGCDAVTLYTYDDEHGEFGWPPTMAGVEDEAAVLAIGRVEKTSVVWNILSLDKAHETEDAQADLMMKGPFLQREKIRSAIAIPLRVAERRVGVMFINYRSYHRFTADDLTNIELFSNQAAVATRNAQLFQAEQQYAQALEAIQTTSAAVSAVLELNELLPMITDKAAAIFRAPATSLMLWADPPETMTIHAAAGLGEDYIQKQRIPRSIVEEIIRTKGMDPAVFDIDREPLGIPGLIQAEDLGSVLATPLKAGRELIGILNIYSRRQPRRFDEREKKLATIFANHATIAIQNAQAYDELKKTKGLVGARTALAWMGMVSSTWRHVINNYATSIQDVVELARLDLDANASPDKIYKRLARISNVAKKIQDSPITAPLHAEEGVESLSINGLIAERVEQLWGKEPHKCVKRNLDLRIEKSATIRANADWLRRVLDILIDNAVEAMAESSTKELTIKTELADGGLALSVMDTGKGIPADVLPILLQSPIPKTKGAKGLGVGLLMAHTIVQTYGGDIRLGPTGPEGTTMVVWFPLERGSS